MDNSSLFARKDGGKLILSDVILKNGTKLKEYVIDWNNDVIIQNYNDYSKNKIDIINTQSIIMIFLQAYDDIIFNIAECGEIKHITRNKSFDGEYSSYNEKIEVYKNMRLAYLENENSHTKVSNFLIVFCNNDMKSSNVKKEISRILDRINSKESHEEIATRIMHLSNECYGLSKILEDLLIEKKNKNKDSME